MNHVNEVPIGTNLCARNTIFLKFYTRAVTFPVLNSLCLFPLSHLMHVDRHLYF